MRLPLPRPSLRTVLLGLVVLAGCNHSERLCPSCAKRHFDACGPAIPVSIDGRPTMLPLTAPTANKELTSEPPEVIALPAQPGECKPVSRTGKTALVQPGEAKPSFVLAKSSPPPQLVVAVQPTAYLTQTSLVAQASPRPRSHGDISVDPCFDHAADYSWLTGRLEHLYVRNVWRVRYAGCDEDDGFGGSLTLNASFPIQEFKDGQLVRVEGQVAHAEARPRDGGPSYQVRAIQILKRP